jgi:hypothetical protein
MARGKELAVVASMMHTCPVCRGRRRSCKVCGGVGQWSIQMFENPPPTPKPEKREPDGLKAFVMKQMRRPV